MAKIDGHGGVRHLKGKMVTEGPTRSLQRCLPGPGKERILESHEKGRLINSVIYGMLLPGGGENKSCGE